VRVALSVTPALLAMARLSADQMTTRGRPRLVDETMPSAAHGDGPRGIYTDVDLD
jgi:hypothetical protein